MPRLPQDRVVVVTGASSGIGRATAVAFARDGARVVLAARRKDRIEKLAAEIRLDGGSAIAIPTDVTRREDVRRLIATAREEFGTVDVLVNNAGVGFYARVEDLKDDELEAHLRVNLYGPLHAIQEALPVMKAAGRGQIINVTSTLGRVAIPLMSAYCMSKFALTALSDSLRVEVRGDGIDVLVVGPGLTHTDFQENARVVGFKGHPARDNKKGVPAERVARAIVRASRARKRQVYLTPDANVLLFMRHWFPGLTDWGLRRWMRDRLRDT